MQDGCRGVRRWRALQVLHMVMGLEHMQSTNDFLAEMAGAGPSAPVSVFGSGQPDKQAPAAASSQADAERRDSNRHAGPRGSSTPLRQTPSPASSSAEALPQRGGAAPLHRLSAGSTSSAPLNRPPATRQEEAAVGSSLALSASADALHRGDANGALDSASSSHSPSRGLDAGQGQVPKLPVGMRRPNDSSGAALPRPGSESLAPAAVNSREPDLEAASRANSETAPASSRRMRHRRCSLQPLPQLMLTSITGQLSPSMSMHASHGLLHVQGTILMRGLHEGCRWPAVYDHMRTSLSLRSMAGRGIAACAGMACCC